MRKLIEAEAILPYRRNTVNGIKNRSRIIQYLRDRSATTREVSEYMGLSRSGVLYHLNLLRKYRIAVKRGRYWRIQVRQRKIDEYIE